MTRDEFISAHPLVEELVGRGVKLIGSGDQLSCRCLFHEDKSPSMSVNRATGLWHCHSGCGGGSVIDLLAKLDSVSPAEILKRNGSSGPAKFKPAAPSPPEKAEITAIYSYTDALGGELFQVVRMVPKTFRQRHKVGDKWVWSMEGVERVLYRLPQVFKSDEVWIVEGEKDADTLVAMGFCATCNVGGAGKWLDGYSDDLKGKRIVLCGDNDDAGRNHVEVVFTALAGKAKEVRHITVPVGKDVSDMVLEIGPEPAKARLLALVADAIPFLNGIRLPVFHVAELEDRYAAHVTRMESGWLDLSKWLPSFRNRVRPLVPGDLCMVLGGTGVGKTAVLSNIALSASPLPTLLFELELPAEILFERLVALKTRMDCVNVERGYQSGDKFGPETLRKAFPALYVCTEAKLTVEKIGELVNRAELKMGQHPRLVLVDYVGLLAGHGTSRYDRFSNIAEELKVLAKSTNTIVVCAVQIGRKGPDDGLEVRLSDGKDSGSIENSAGLVLGCWRPEADKLVVKVLKNTKGTAGTTVECNYDGPKLRITERALATAENP